MSREVELLDSSFDAAVMHRSSFVPTHQPPYVDMNNSDSGCNHRYKSNPQRDRILMGVRCKSEDASSCTVGDPFIANVLVFLSLHSFSIRYFKHLINIALVIIQAPTVQCWVRVAVSEALFSRDPRNCPRDANQ